MLAQIKTAPRRRESSVVSTTNVRKYKNKEDGNVWINNYVVEKTLGKGSFAEVKLCRENKTGVKYAIKQMNKRELKKKNAGHDKTAYDCVLEELLVL